MDMNFSRALERSYRNCVSHYQRLLKTHKTDDEHDYIKERIAACNAAIKALSEPQQVADEEPQECAA